jgi:hypothetical protein
MKINEGSFDRAARVVAGVVLLAAAYFYLEGTWALVGAVVGAVALLTGVVGFCPAYGLFGLSTCPLKRAE